MKEIKVKPGDVVATNFGLYQHLSLVSDRLCENGKHMLISATNRTGTVKEESWNKTTQNRYTYRVNKSSTKDATDILHDARSKINVWKYSISNRNCEHFVNWSLGLKMESAQVTNTIVAGLAGLAFSALVSKKHSLLKHTVIAASVAGLALVSTQAQKKESTYE